MERNNSSSDSARSEKKDSDDAKVDIQAETEDIYTDDSLDPVYQAKARILNDALQEIGMGKYQVWLACTIEESS